MPPKKRIKTIKSDVEYIVLDGDSDEENAPPSNQSGGSFKNEPICNNDVKIIHEPHKHPLAAHNNQNQAQPMTSQMARTAETHQNVSQHQQQTVKVESTKSEPIETNEAADAFNSTSEEPEEETGKIGYKPTFPWL